MHVTLKEVSAKETLKDSTFKAKLEGEGIVDITITIKAETAEDLRDAIPLLQKGAVFELKLIPLQRENYSLSDFQILEGADA